MEDNTFCCPKCKKKDYIALNPLEAYCLFCQKYFNKKMIGCYKNRMNYDDIINIIVKEDSKDATM